MKDSCRYNGKTTIYENYDAVLSFQSECISVKEWRKTEKDKADNSWLIQCILYLIVASLWSQENVLNEKYSTIADHIRPIHIIMPMAGEEGC